MDVTLRHCNCLKSATFRVRDMLVAEGFTVQIRTVLRPGVLQVSVGEKIVWSWALWNRQIPDQKTLAGMVAKAG